MPNLDSDVLVKPFSMIDHVSAVSASVVSEASVSRDFMRVNFFPGDLRDTLVPPPTDHSAEAYDYTCRWIDYVCKHEAWMNTAFPRLRLD